MDTDFALTYIISPMMHFPVKQKCCLIVLEKPVE